MPQILVIVESPAKCDKIEKFLGNGYKCLASFGHLTKLSSLKNIDINNNFGLTFDTIDEKNKQIQKLQKAINNASEVILATDDDREGEAIAWHICKLFKLSLQNTKRILFNEITEKAILNAIKNPTLVNLDIVHAQQTRQILDLLLGYRISPILWKNISSNNKNSLSAGRCQTPALKLVYENYKDLQNNTGTKIYNTTGYFTSKLFPFILDKQFEDEKNMNAFLEESIEFKHILTCDAKKDSSRNPPLPFTTSSLQQSASNVLHISPKETMQICQKLYEAGLITYMRTDSKNYSSEFIKTASDYIDKNYGKNFINDKINIEYNKKESKDESKKETKKENKKESKKESKNTQDAHEAIRPTNIFCEFIKENYSKKEISLYKLIWKNTIKSCMSPAIYQTILNKITAPQDLFYKYTAEEVIFLGWQIIDNDNDNEEENKAKLAFNYLPKIKNKNINFNKIISKVSVKNLKTHYTEAKLVQLLEQHGIGRPSTFSTLIDKIQEREYVKKENVEGFTINCVDLELDKDTKLISKKEEKKEFGNEKNKLIIQPIGIIVIEFLINYFDKLFQYKYTEDMENKLDLISKGEYIWIDICNEYNREILNLIEPVLNNVKKEEYKLDNKHSYIIGKYGPVIKCTEGEKISFKSIKKDLNHDDIKNGKYNLKDIIEDEKKATGKLLGQYENKDVYLKKGKYGLFIEWGENNKSIKHIKKNENLITLEDVKSCLESKIIREINENLSIRKGNYGDYIFYKTTTMKKPQFYKLNNFDDNYKTCSIDYIKSWIREKYNL